MPVFEELAIFGEMNIFGEMDIFGGVLDIIGGVAEFGLDIHRGHGDSDTQVTDYSKDGLNFVIDVLKGVTKFVGSSRDREIILKVIEGLDTTGKYHFHISRIFLNFVKKFVKLN
mgnify:CR=1 FL=1